MKAFAEAHRKPLHWIGSSFRDLLDCPPHVRKTVGVALNTAQHGGKHPSAKPWKGEGPGILEIVEDFDRNTYRAVYTVRFARAVYVLHVFQKKSKSGIKTPRADVQLTRARLKTAEAHYATEYEEAIG